jgi:hypothetical protein
MDTMYHAIHAFGLAEILKTGMVAGVDNEYFWSLIDNTYIDDVGNLFLFDDSFLTDIGSRSDDV